MAMLASEAFGGGAPVSILATDISDRGARPGGGGASTRSARCATSADAAREGSSPRTGEEQRRKQLRSMVRLRKHNLVADVAPPAGEAHFDLILCRNVLIYFGAGRWSARGVPGVGARARVGS